MPSGVYERTPEQLRIARTNLAKGRAPEARAKAADTLFALAQSDEWRERVSQSTCRAMHSPEVRERHLAGLQRALDEYGCTLTGGNGREPVPIVRHLSKVLEPMGFIREFAVKTRGHGTSHNAPTSYKADFGHPELRVAIEIDGPCHQNRQQRQLDQKKNEVLADLGWVVLRVPHSGIAVPEECNA